MTGPLPLTLTVSVVAYDTPLAELQSLLDSLLTAIATLPEAGLRVRTRVSLVDNDDNPRLARADFSRLDKQLQTLYVDLEVLGGHGNVGYGRGHNLVIHHTADDYHLVLNPDVELAPDSLAIGLKYLQENKDVAVVSPYAVGRDGEQQQLCKRYPSLFTLLVRGFLPAGLKARFEQRLSRYEMRDLPEDRPSDGIPLVSGCCMLCRADLLRAVGGFDERYFLYFEDFDLSLRLAARARLVYLPGMKIRHYGGNAAGKGWRHIGLYLRSACRFFNTWGWRFIQ